MKEENFFKILRYMGINPNSRSGYHISKSLYNEYIKKVKLQKIIKDIEESKKGPYYLMDYLMKQKQENIINRVIVENNIQLRRYF